MSKVFFTLSQNSIKIYFADARQAMRERNKKENKIMKKTLKIEKTPDKDEFAFEKQYILIEQGRSGTYYAYFVGTTRGDFPEMYNSGDWYDMGGRAFRRLKDWRAFARVLEAPLADVLKANNTPQKIGDTIEKCFEEYLTLYGRI